VPHAVVRLHLQVQLRIAVHDTAFLYEALKGTNFHGQPKGFIGKTGQTVTSYLGLSRKDLLLGLLRFGLFSIDDQRERSQRFLGCDVNRINIFAIFLFGSRGRRGSLGLLVPILLQLDLSLDQMQKLRMSPQEARMAEDIFAGILARLMEAVHVELPNEAIDIPVPEEFGKDMVLELIDLLDGELAAVGHPVNHRLVFLVLQDLKALLDKICHRIFTCLH